MAADAQVRRRTAEKIYPEAEVMRVLQIELQKIADQGSILRPDWEPLLDSKRVVGTVLALEKILHLRIPPDKVVRKGGYDSVNDAMDDILVRIRRIWDENRMQKVHNEQ